MKERWRKWQEALGKLWVKKAGKSAERENISRTMELLYPEGDREKQAESYCRKRWKGMALVLAAGLLLAAVLWLTQSQNGILEDGYLLPRKEQAYEQKMELIPEEGEPETITIQVAPRKLTDGECEKLLEETVKQMEKRILGENRSLEEVRNDLNLVQEIEGTPITVEWELDSYKVLNLDGSIRREAVKEEGSLVELTARLRCGDKEQIYQARARILPPIQSPLEQWQAERDAAVKEADTKSEKEDYQELPDQIGDRTVNWAEKKSTAAGAVLLLTLVCIPFVYTAGDRELKKKLKNRERQLQQDYAGMVSKLLLLLNAGASVRMAWERMIQDYRKKRDRGQGGQRFVYEEMIRTGRELQNGMSEARAYERFGQRCGLVCYLKLGALLEQNMKNGSKGLGELLQAEVLEAFEMRKDLARVRGEEASTKLLFPMILMLLLVMVFILVPAGMSMRM